MELLDRVEYLLKAIKEKHGSACRFSVKNFGRGLGYETYIAGDVSPCHVNHGSLHDALERLEDFLKIDNLLAHNAELAERKIHDLMGSVEDQMDKIAELRLLVPLGKRLELTPIQ